MAPDDFVMTLDSDEESPSEAVIHAKVSGSKAVDDAQLDPALTFDISGDPYSDLLHGVENHTDLVKSGSKPVRLISAPCCSLMDDSKLESNICG